MVAKKTQHFGLSPQDFFNYWSFSGQKPSLWTSRQQGEPVSTKSAVLSAFMGEMSS